MKQIDGPEQFGDTNGAWFLQLNQGVNLLVPANLYDALQQQHTGTTPVMLSPVERTQLLSEALFELSNNLTDRHDGYILATHELEAVVAEQGSANLTEVQESLNASSLHWEDIPSFFRRLAAPGIDQQYIPVDGSAQVLYYRTDLFTENGIMVPRTWSEVIQVAERLNSTEKDIWGFCIQPDEGEHLYVLCMVE